MIISINNQTKDVAEHATLQSILFDHIGEKQNGIAVAVNQKVISKTDQAHCKLQPGDQVLIIKATQGG